MNNLKDLHELTLLELPLYRHDTNPKVLSISENDLEEYLTSNCYNIYTSKTLSFKDVVDNDLTVDSTYISDIMDELSFFSHYDENDSLRYSLHNEIESRIIEIIQDVCDVKEGLYYYISGLYDDALIDSIDVFKVIDDSKVCSLIYSYENDDYIIKK